MGFCDISIVPSPYFQIYSSFHSGTHTRKHQHIIWGLNGDTVALERKTNSQEGIAYLLLALKQCSRGRDMERGKTLHQYAYNHGLHTNKFVAAALVTMYSKCGDVPHARFVFDAIISCKNSDADVVLWNSLLLGYAENGEAMVALDIFTNNVRNQRVDPVTCIGGLKACARLTRRLDKYFCLTKGIAVHKQAEVLGYGADVFLASNLVDMYSKCGSIPHARAVFNKMKHRDVVSWTSLILGHAQNEKSLVALELYSTMSDSRNTVTFIAALKACVGMLNQLDKGFCLEKGLEIHREVAERKLQDDMFVASSLLDMYTKLGSMKHARAVFDTMIRRDVVCWTSLLHGYAENGESEAALDVFACMQDREVNAVTIASAVKACASLSCEFDRRFCLEKGIEIHRRARTKGFESDVFLASSLVDLYSKCGSLLHMRALFDNMASRAKEVVAWTSIILGYVENGKSLIALDLFNNMDCAPNSVTFIAAFKAWGALASQKLLGRLFCLEKGVSLHRRAHSLGFAADLSVANNVIYMYGKCGSMLHLASVHRGLTARNVVTWNFLILGYTENGEYTLALECFISMDCQPNSITFVAALKACGELSALKVGEGIHAQVRKCGVEDNPVVATSLVDFYGKCGAVDAAEEVFERMHSKDAVAWNALIAGYSLLGNTSQVFCLVKRMQDSGLDMDGVTLSLALTACSHTGAIEQGKKYFESMTALGILPCMEHYACMVDMLGRANRLGEAMSLIQDMPFEPSRVVWRSLLSTSRSWNNLEVGRVAFNALLNHNDKIIDVKALT